MDKKFEGIDDPINLIEFVQRQGDPTASLEYFLGGADYITDDRGHIIISDEYDFNINRENQLPSPQTGKDVGRGEGFLNSLIPRKNYLYNILQGVGTLVGPEQGKGAPIKLDIGTPEEMREQLRQAGVEGYAEGGRVGFANGDEVLEQGDRLGLMKFALEQQQPTELTPNEIRSEEHFQRIKDEPGLGENAPLIQTAAYTYGLLRPIAGAIKAAGQHVLSNQLKKLRGSDLYHGGYGWQSGSKALWTTPSVKLARLYKNRRAESLSSRSLTATTQPAVWKAGTDTLEKVLILDKPTKVFIAEVRNEITRLENQIASRGGHLGRGYQEAHIEIRALNHYLKHPKKMI